MIYYLSDEQYEKIKRASEPVPAMYLSGGKPMYPSPQKSANQAWQEIAREHGVKWMTIRPRPGFGERYFIAEPL